MMNGLTVYELENLNRKAAARDAALSYLRSAGGNDLSKVKELLATKDARRRT
jgi:hypothetical protein